jgi:4-hydroxybutyrate CoA-transferase
VLHVYDLDVLVPTDDPILEVPMVEITDETRQIAEYIAALIEDGSTLELGIGRIPHSLLGF